MSNLIYSRAPETLASSWTATAPHLLGKVQLACKTSAAAYCTDYFVGLSIAEPHVQETARARQAGRGQHSGSGAAQQRRTPRPFPPNESN